MAPGVSASDHLQCHTVEQARTSSEYPSKFCNQHRGQQHNWLIGVAEGQP
jgi:hypothetical protein